MDLATLCPLLSTRSWPKRRLDEALASIDVLQVVREMDALRSVAPSRHHVDKSYLSDSRNGIPSSTGDSNRLEELTAIAMINQNRRLPLPDAGWIRLVDYQTPLKARRTDKGVGKIDLLGLTHTRRLTVIELKAANMSGSVPDSPISALMEGLTYSAILTANRQAFSNEIQERFGTLINGDPPLIIVLAPLSWWTNWTDAPAAGNWWPAYQRIIGQIEQATGVRTLLLAFDDVAVIKGNPGEAPRLTCVPSLSKVEPKGFIGIEPPAPRAPDQYLKALNKHLWKRARNLPDEALDGVKRNNGPPVASEAKPEASLIVPDDATLAKEICGLIPVAQRHRHFRSFKSSQALAQTVFGAIQAYGRGDVLSGIRAECGRPAFTAHGVSELVLEYDVDTLSEPRPTSIDVLVKGDRYQVAVECKLTEQEFGCCSRTKSFGDQPPVCNGSYSFQKGRKTRCALSVQGISYWQHLPRLFEWQSDQDHQVCPFSETYQIGRNALAVTVSQNGRCDPSTGHFLAVYDERNPAFQPGGRADKQFEAASAAALHPGMIRRVSWQAIATYLANFPEFSWLTDGLREKYGFVADISLARRQGQD